MEETQGLEEWRIGGVAKAKRDELRGGGMEETKREELRDGGLEGWRRYWRGIGI